MTSAALPTILVPIRDCRGHACDSTAAFWLPVALATADTPTGKPTWTEFSGCQSAAPVLQNAASAGTWVKANAGQYGFFRVQYDEALWARLVAAAPTLPPTDLAGLLEGQLGAGRGRGVGIDTFLNLVGCAPFQGRAREGGWVQAEGDRGWLVVLGNLTSRIPGLQPSSLPTSAHWARAEASLARRTAFPRFFRPWGSPS